MEKQSPTTGLDERRKTLKICQDIRSMARYFIYGYGPRVSKQKRNGGMNS